MIDLKTFYIFLLGAVLTLLYYIEQLIETKEHEGKSKKQIISLAFVKCCIAGIIIVLVYYSLMATDLEFSIMGNIIRLNEWVSLFIASTVSLFGSELFKILKFGIEKKVKGKVQ